MYDANIIISLNIFSNENKCIINSMTDWKYLISWIKYIYFLAPNENTHLFPTIVCEIQTLLIIPCFIHGFEMRRMKCITIQIFQFYGNDFIFQ